MALSLRKLLNRQEETWLSISVQEVGLSTNCGASLITSASASCTQGSHPVTFTLREVFAVLDSVKDITIYFGVKGFNVLSDRVAGTSRDFVGLDDQISRITTSDFVRYLISRKIGVVFRGPSTINTNHPGASVICSWVWVPLLKNLISADTEVYNLPKKLEDRYPAFEVETNKLLFKQCEDFENYEVGFTKIKKLKKDQSLLKPPPPPPKPCAPADVTIPKGTEQVYFPKYGMYFYTEAKAAWFVAQGSIIKPEWIVPNERVV